MNDGPALSRNPDPASVEAADLVAPYVKIQREKVFQCIKSHSPHPGISDEGIQDETGLHHSAYRARRIDLWRDGRIKKIPDGAIARSGVTVAAWRVREEGEDPDYVKTKQAIRSQIAKKVLKKARYWEDGSGHHLEIPRMILHLRENDAEVLGLLEP